jgi:hypothetical protein
LSIKDIERSVQNAEAAMGLQVVRSHGGDWPFAFVIGDLVLITLDHGTVEDVSKLLRQRSLQTRPPYEEEGSPGPQLEGDWDRRRLFEYWLADLPPAPELF